MRPLADIRVLAVEQYGAGPFGSLHLADLGADVIKIEDPKSRGDVSRYVPPFQEGEDSLFYETFNRNKRSVSLDLRSASGRRVFEALVRTADAVYSNLRGDVPAKLGLTYSDLSDLNPLIVCVSLSGFGTSGEEAALPGYDYMFQALAGWMTVTGSPGGPPTKTGLSLVDFSAGVEAALGLLAAVHAARRDGHGSDCDLSLLDVATSLLTYEATWTLNSDWVSSRRERSAHPSLVPFQLFKGVDDRWFVVACAKEVFWQNLTDALEDRRLKEVRFANFAERNQHREELIALMDEVFAGSSAQHWCEVLTRAGVPVSQVRTIGEALDDLVDSGSDMVIEVDHHRFGRIKEVRTPIKIGEDQPTHRKAPRRNEHADEILGELGLSRAEIEVLAAEGAFG